MDKQTPQIIPKRLLLTLPHQESDWGRKKDFLLFIRDVPLESMDALKGFLKAEYNWESIDNLKSLEYSKTDEWRGKLLSDLIPYIADLALKVEDIDELPILYTGQRAQAQLTRRQISYILASMFFSTINKQGDEEVASLLPITFDFKAWISSITDQKRNGSNIQKLRCLLHYFWKIRELEKGIFVEDQIEAPNVKSENKGANKVQENPNNTNANKQSLGAQQKTAFDKEKSQMNKNKGKVQTEINKQQVDLKKKVGQDPKKSAQLDLKGNAQKEQKQYEVKNQKPNTYMKTQHDKNKEDRVEEQKEENQAVEKEIILDEQKVEEKLQDISIKEKDVLVHNEIEVEANQNIEIENNQEKGNNHKEEVVYTTNQEKEVEAKEKEEQVDIKLDKKLNFLDQIISYERLIVDSKIDLEDFLSTSTNHLLGVVVDNTRGIEQFTEFPCVHTDFANKFLGGGVLRTGCVQEEIMFATTPELLAGIVFSQVLFPDETILISGAHRYCQFTGYGDTFTFVKNNPIPKEELNAKCMQSYVLAMNSTPFKQNPLTQYQSKFVMKEMVKAFSGFQLSKSSPPDLPIVTGNWGCGIYKGDPQLKFLIQWAVASALKRRLFYVPFNNPALNQISQLTKVLQKGQVNHLFGFLMKVEKLAKDGNVQNKIFELAIQHFNKIAAK